MSTMTETVTMSTPNTKTDKKFKLAQKKIIILRLPSQLLARFPATIMPSGEKDTTVKSDPDSTTTSNGAVNGEGNATPADNVSESPSTPAPSDLANGDAKKKSAPGSRGGVKRGLTESTSRPRGRPGPKKKARLDDGADSGVRTSFGGAVPLSKLGPRANQGAINAQLRALDRSGKPCRKWEKKAFTLKSFTGVVWEIPSWKAPARQDIVNGDANGASNTAESDGKPNESSAGLVSEKSNQGDQSDQVEPTGLATPAASSPLPPPPAIAAET